MWTTRLLSNLELGIPVPIDFHVGLDLRVLGLALGLSAVTAVLFGLAPALRASRPDLLTALKNEVIAFQGSRGFNARNALVVLQVSISLVLLIGTGLFVRSLLNSGSIDLGFRPDHLLLASIDPNLQGYSESRAKAFFFQAQERLNGSPGMVSAAIADFTPLGILQPSRDARPEGRETERADSVDTIVATPRYFETLGIPFVQGRDFRDETEQGQRVATVNDTLARR